METTYLLKKKKTAKIKAKSYLKFDLFTPSYLSINVKSVKTPKTTLTSTDVDLTL